jgi:hypothetical protein
MENANSEKKTTDLREELHEREVKGVEELPAEERAAVVEDAEHNPDPTTRRETIEKQLMEMDRSDAGSETGS